ncbi:MAG TPA: tyrosine--tRNA ligase [bacterium]|nr:tyrosine--tRNA ligase [bacterium]
MLTPTDTQIDTIIRKGVSRVIDADSLRKRLTSGKQLRIKLGIDPTAPIIHIGHAVPILKLRQFQELGHHIILLIGDATAQVGDSSDKDAERPMLQREETRRNAARYVELFSRVIDPSKTEIYYNSEGLDKLNFCDVGELAKHFSVAEMLDRDNFSKRYKEGVRISLQEFLYPLMQGYDSVALRADVELGGNDQYFNLLAGRTLQEAFGQEKQDIVMMNLIAGTDGQKMSKTKKNFIAIDTPPNEMFVKVMEISDDLIPVYWEHCTLVDMAFVDAVRERLYAGEHPRMLKMELAHAVVSLFCDAASADEARDYFERVISQGSRPSESDVETIVLPQSAYPILVLLKELGFAQTTGEARDAVKGGGVKINDTQEMRIDAMISLQANASILVQMGKKKFAYVRHS